ncbi:hypothetical protein GGX14DRAFT_544968 [Mycena pura]|uniref:Transmembrane protein n=1 Tax=Mycena pura TaxID=153505 RepID=A0AAD6V133_9AGAR|nr:hypothetical protein GGX14DRAFT_544968 [Mycena pura]
MTVVHHIYLPFASPDFFIFDLVLLIVETTMWLFVLMFLTGPIAILSAMNFIMLSAFVVTRVSGSAWRDKSLDFFNGCDLGQPQYTAMETLFGRPTSRALSRITSGSKSASTLVKAFRSWSASASARVYTLRAFIFWNIIICAIAPLSVGLTGPIFVDLPFGLVTVAHHIYVPFSSPKFFTFDLVLLTLETIWSFVSMFLAGIPLFALVNFIMFSAFIYARRAGSAPRAQTFDFFVGCKSVQPEYTPLETLFGRSASRGESRAIVCARAIIVLCLCLVIPGFGAYMVLVVPITAQTFTRDLKTSHAWHGTKPQYSNKPENITILTFFDNSYQEYPDITISITTANVTQYCAVDGGVAGCPFSWSVLPAEGLVVSANFTEKWAILYIKAGEGNPQDVDDYSEPIPLAAGAHLVAILSQTQRLIFSVTALDLFGFTTPTRAIILRPTLLLQEDRQPPNSGANTVVQDYTDASILNGIATFGGFWTFMDGAFAILFGANILSFLYAFRTEGGQPGTENAGIIAFMRERFVEGPKIRDVEPQHLSEDVSHSEEIRKKGNGVSSDGLGVETDGNAQHCEPGEEEGGLESGFAYLAGVA